MTKLKKVSKQVKKIPAIVNRYNYEFSDRCGEKSFKPSVTVPGQDTSIQAIITRQRNGQPLLGAQTPKFLIENSKALDDHLFDIDDIHYLDDIEKIEYNRQLKLALEATTEAVKGIVQKRAQKNREKKQAKKAAQQEKTGSKQLDLEEESKKAVDAK